MDDANPKAVGATQDDLPGVIDLVDRVMRTSHAQSMFSLKVTDDDDESISFHFSERGLELGRQTCRRHLECTRRRLTSILFGEHLSRRVKIPDEWAGLVPFYFPIWILDHS